MSKLSREDTLQLIPAYVIGALDDDERDQVEVLLTVDNEAQAILQQYRQIESVLPLMAVQRQPASDLKDRLLARLNENNVLPDRTNNITPMPKKRKQKPTRRHWLVSAAAVLIVVISGVVVALTSREDINPQAVYYELSDRYDSERIPISSEENAVEGDLIISSDGQRAAMRVRQLPEITDEQAFQLWMVTDEGVIDGGVYPYPENYALYIVIPNQEPIYHYQRFGVSIEPATGSPLGNAPTGDRVFGVSLIPDDDATPQEQ